MKKLYILFGMAAFVCGSLANAQSTTLSKGSKSSPEDGCVTSDGKTECRFFRMDHDSSMMKRAAIGVSVQTTGTKRDTIGVFIERVTPNGPAEKAGIVEGERIAAINGVDLRVAAADVEDSYAAGLASHRLMREMQKLTPGSAVSLKVYSGGRFRDVQVTTARAFDLETHHGEMGMFPKMPGMPGMPNMQIFREMENNGAMMLHTPRAMSPVRVRVAPPMREMRFELESAPSVHIHLDAPAPPAVPGLPSKVSARISRSI